MRRKSKKGLGMIAPMKKATSELVPKLAQGAARGVGMIGAEAGSNLLSHHVPKIPKKIHGPALFILGTIGDAFLTEPHLNAFAQGVQTNGSMKMASELIPAEVKSKIGLAGIGAVEIDSTPDWDSVTQDAYDEAPLAALPDYSEDYAYPDMPTQAVDLEQAALNSMT